MIRPALTILGTMILGLVGIYYAQYHYQLDAANVITCIGFLFTTSSVILLYFQLQSGLHFQRRRATLDYIQGPIVNELLPLEKELKAVLGRTNLLFEETSPIALPLATDTKLYPLLLDILNFYERMAIAVRISVLDEDMVYDDKGVLFVHLYEWVSPLLRHFRDHHHDERLYINLSALANDWQRRYNREMDSHHKQSTRLIKSTAMRKRDVFT